MSSYEEITRAVSCKFNDQIKKACEPIFEYFNLNYFCYFRLTRSGQFSYFSNNISWNEYFGDKKFHLLNPYHRHPDHFQDEVILLKDLQSDEFKQIMDSSSCNFNINLSLQILKKTNFGFEAFAFSSASSDERYIRMLLGDLPLLKLFTRKLRENYGLFFSNLEDHQLDLVQHMGSVFYDKCLQQPRHSRAKRKFLLQLGVDCDNPLSSQEVKVLRLLLEGFSAGKVAPQIYLSKRTVEHHIERMKAKLGCVTKSELIQKARELEVLDFLGGM